MKIAVSYINSRYDKEKTIKLIDESDADYIHVDIMDGKYVANNNIDEETFLLLASTSKALDVHLMVNDPLKYLTYLKNLKVEAITVHPKAVLDFSALLQELMARNIKVGIAINPKEKVEEFAKYIVLIDKVLIMGVEPGSGGQKFIDSVIPKINEIRKLNENVEIGIDGGINDEVITKLKGLDYVVSGSFICNSSSFNEQINKLKVNYHN